MEARRHGGMKEAPVVHDDEHSWLHVLGTTEYCKFYAKLQGQRGWAEEWARMPASEKLLAVERYKQAHEACDQTNKRCAFWRDLKNQMYAQRTNRKEDRSVFCQRESSKDRSRSPKGSRSFGHEAARCCGPSLERPSAERHH